LQHGNDVVIMKVFIPQPHRVQPTTTVTSIPHPFSLVLKSMFAVRAFFQNVSIRRESVVLALPRFFTYFL
jgi:hypothetical protein